MGPAANKAHNVNKAHNALETNLDKGQLRTASDIHTHTHTHTPYTQVHINTLTCIHTQTHTHIHYMCVLGRI